MLNDFREAFNAMIQERTEEVGSKVLMENETYRKSGEDSDKLFRQIKDLLPDEFKPLIFELDRLMCYQQAIAEEVMYEQGIKDGIELKSILKLVV